MKTIGILGGLGPQATVAFEARIHRIAQRRIPPHFNAGYPPMVTLYFREPPFVVEEGLPVLPFRANPRLLAAAAALGSLVDLLVVPSNAPNFLRTEIERAAGRPMIDAIALALAEIERRGWRRVGVLGIGPPTFYVERLMALGLAVDQLAGGERAPLDAAILAVMEGRDGAEERAAARAAVDALQARGPDGILIGCSEIPLLLDASDDLPDRIDPMVLLAEAAVEAALADAPPDMGG